MFDGTMKGFDQWTCWIGEVIVSFDAYHDRAKVGAHIAPEVAGSRCLIDTLKAPRMNFGRLGECHLRLVMSVLSWRHTHDAFEMPNKMRLIDKAELAGNLHARQPTPSRWRDRSMRKCI